MTSHCRYIDFKFPGLPQIGCAFTTRAVSAQAFRQHSPESLQTALNEDLQTLQNRHGLLARQSVHQVHGSTLLFVDRPGENRQAKADALATAQSGLALVIRTADCQPILMSDLSGSCIAALHVGWRANRNETLLHWVQTFCRHFGVRPEELLAVRGPSLGPARSEFVHFAQEWGTQFLPYFNPKQQTMDLWRLTRNQLFRAGLLQEHVFGLDLCTFSLPELFYSHRRDRDLGRQAGIIWIEQPGSMS